MVVRDGNGSGPVGGHPPCSDHGRPLLVGDDGDDVMAVTVAVAWLLVVKWS